ncbi:MAG: CRISPR-associated protein Cas5 [Elusimicrobia bacterium RIFOXYB2_FULL_50_12]|nr:MAG: CRISPR-associated protein Cas5 [Elusimicrobia bacterium RIFOXYB2_FULL_50_12]
MGKYDISMEISGLTAMWTRPDTGDCPVSYPVPTYSAVRGIFESILWGPAIQIIPTKVTICSPLQYHNYKTNYGGPLRKPRVISSGGGFQLLATVLINVHYQLYAEVIPLSQEQKNIMPLSAKMWDDRTTSPGHAYKDIFERRLKRGQCYSIPFLGWKEFGPTYFGPIRDNSIKQTDINMVIPSMLREVFSRGYSSDVDFSFDQNLSILNGVLIFPRREKCNAK